VQGMTVDEERMRANLELTHGALFSQRVLHALVEAGSSRDDAYRVVQELAQRAWDQGIPLRELLAADERASGLDLDSIFDYTYYIRHAPEILARLDAIA
jgi:adenylosuccinate lyase